MLDLWGVLFVGQSFFKTSLISEPPEPTRPPTFCTCVVPKKKNAASAKSAARRRDVGLVEVASGGTPKSTNPGIWRWLKYHDYFIHTSPSPKVQMKRQETISTGHS